MKWFTLKRTTPDLQMQQARIEVAPGFRFHSLFGVLSVQSKRKATLRRSQGKKNWRERLFVLDGEMLRWYRNEHGSEPMMDGAKLRGQIPLEVRMLISAGSALLLQCYSANHRVP